MDHMEKVCYIFDVPPSKAVRIVVGVVVVVVVVSFSCGEVVGVVVVVVQL